MSIKEHYLYPVYLNYLKRKRLSKGAMELIKLSEDSFFEFKLKYDTNENFKEKQDRIQRSIIRENKINILTNSNLVKEK